VLDSCIASMAEDDDLDAFFEEVNEAEANVTGPENEETKEEKDSEAEPPAKRPKTSAIGRPRGVVVAAATSVVMPAKQREELESASQEQQQQQQHQQQPRQELPQQKSTAAATHNMQQSTHGASGPSIGPAFPVSSTTATNNNSSNNKESTGKKKASIRLAAGQAWVDPSLDEWPENDYRIFVGNLSNEVTDQALFQHFHKYPSVAKAKVVRHNNNPDKSKGYGFVSFLDPLECARAIREMDQTFLLSRPVRVKRSDWKERDFKLVKSKEKKEKKQQTRMGLRM
jgi:RNA recognition motif. (a.k.a. RRM, RBD, or RNP domain)